MFDYINAIYYGDPIHMPVPTQLDDPDSTLFRHLERVRREMGGPFAQKLDAALRVELHGAQSAAFREGLRLGGQLMLNILEEVER